MTELTETEVHHMRHALGLNQGKVAYRNHFVTDPEGPDGIVWEGLVARGLATKRKGSPLSGGDPIYLVTAEGRKAIGAPLAAGSAT